ncbi:NAD-dependent epimerase/dehydratase family protein [Heyndrickxia acidicola]|uniref:NAD-dependent epimerase/dehydratase family protein n=1 Tax=Heyndrickxia acidicola TaxID=209389 RepID=A0ABU6MG72_9BACI|nr:NAD-dependent epimerase/dehydratase family protein [Heyndrickxia acidicola]MED1203678.1 NAD-dependent epimerase/dehydratase family protein [Heyndrickxia acidicola]
MKVLVTGGAGFIGSHTVDLLVESGYDVLVIDNLCTGKKENISTKAAFFNLDINSKEVEQVFCEFQPDILIHLAAQVKVSISLGDPFRDAMENIMGTIRLLSYCDKYGVQKVIFASSAAVYGENHQLPLKESAAASPVSFYGVSKSTCESYIRLFNHYNKLPFTILRYANVYGPRQTADAEGGIVSIFLNNIAENKPLVIYGDGEQTRDFIFVKDVAKANVAAITKGDNEIINLGTETNTSINRLSYMCRDILKCNIVPSYESARAGDIPNSFLANSKAKKLLNWIPSYTLEEGLKETAKSIKP